MNRVVEEMQALANTPSVSQRQGQLECQNHNEDLLCKENEGRNRHAAETAKSQLMSLRKKWKKEMFQPIRHCMQE